MADSPIAKQLEFVGPPIIPAEKTYSVSLFGKSLRITQHDLFRLTRTLGLTPCTSIVR